MTTTDRKSIEAQMNNLTALINGKTVDGVKMGDPGVSAEWVKETRATLAGMLVK